MNLIIADPTLHDMAGHSFEYARSLSANADSFGYRCTTLTQRCVSDDVRGAMSTVPCFSYRVEHNFRPPHLMRLLGPCRFLYALRCWNQAVHKRMMLRDLQEAESKLELNTSSLVISPTMYVNQIMPLVEWAERLPIEKRPQFALVFHSSAYPEFTHSDVMERLYRRGFRRLERSPVRRHFHLFTDTQELVDEFQGYTSLAVNQVPIPHAGGVEKEDSPRCPLPSSGGQKPLRLTYLGYSNGPNKGFHYFAPLLERLRPQLEAGKLQVELQANVPHASWHPVQSGLRRLRQMQGVTLQVQALNSKEYYRLLERADLVLLPYTTETYHSQTSGVFSEAAAHGKPVIVPRGTWMARQLKADAAGVTFIPKDLTSMHEAVLNGLGRHEELGKLAARRAPAWRARHSVPAYLDTIFKTVGVG
jgi:glycosyltransferase involved in cell wall biosynthesis